MENQIYQLFVDNEFYFIIAKNQNDAMKEAHNYQCFAEPFDKITISNISLDSMESELKILNEDSGQKQTIKELFHQGETGVIGTSIN